MLGDDMSESQSMGIAAVATAAAEAGAKSQIQAEDTASGEGFTDVFESLEATAVSDTEGAGLLNEKISDLQPQLTGFFTSLEYSSDTPDQVTLTQGPLQVMGGNMLPQVAGGVPGATGLTQLTPEEAMKLLGMDVSNKPLRNAGFIQGQDLAMAMREMTAKQPLNLNSFFEHIPEGVRSFQAMLPKPGQFSAIETISRDIGSASAVKSIGQMSGNESQSPLSVHTSIVMADRVNSQTNMLPAQITSPQWSNQIGERVNWMIGQNIQQAEIKLNPPDLGLLEIKIKFSAEQASVSFGSANAQVREALENAMPKLREMFEESGLDLANVNVFSQSQQDAQNQFAGESSEQTSENLDGDNSDLTESETTPMVNKASLGLVDIYA